MAKTSAAEIAARAAAGLQKPAQANTATSTGRGLAGFLPNKPGVALEDALRLPLELIEDNPRQARQLFDPDRLGDLAASIQERGLLQPIVVRPVGSRFIIVNGERRKRAYDLLRAQMPDDERWRTIPATIRNYDSDAEAAIDTAVENLLREDLTLVEEAEMYAELIAGWGLNPDRANRELARRTGIDRKRIDRVRLIGRYPHLADKVAEGSLTLVQAFSVARNATVGDSEATSGDEIGRLERTELGDEVESSPIMFSSDAAFGDSGHADPNPAINANNNLGHGDPNSSVSPTPLPRTQAGAWNSLWYAQRNILRLRQRVTPKVLAELAPAERPTMIRTVSTTIQELQALLSELEAADMAISTESRERAASKNVKR